MEANKQNKFGIIIPNYNNEKWLPKCLDSILKQTYTNYEVIFIDDMSTDNSIEVVKTYVNKMNIKIVKLKQKRYNGGARNEGYLYLSDDVDYIIYLDSDDWLMDKDVLKFFNDNLQNDIDVLFTGLRQEWSYKFSDWYPDYPNKYYAFMGWSGSSSKAVKKELAFKCLYPEGTLKEDRTMHRKICMEMKTFDFKKRITHVWNHQNSESVTTKKTSFWKTSTIIHYANTLQLSIDYKGKDKQFDKLLEHAVELTKQEMEKGGDKQH